MKIVAMLLLGISPALVLAGELAAVVPQQEPTESSCSFMLSSKDVPSTLMPVPGLSVLHPPTSQPKLKIELDPGVTLEAVVCWRSIADLAPNDDWAVRTDVPLYIKEDTESTDARALVLELTEPGYRLRLISGPPLSSAQVERVESLIDTFNRRR